MKRREFPGLPDGQVLQITNVVAGHFPAGVNLISTGTSHDCKKTE